MVILNNTWQGEGENDPDSTILQIVYTHSITMVFQDSADNVKAPSQVRAVIFNRTKAKKGTLTQFCEMK